MDRKKSSERVDCMEVFYRFIDTLIDSYTPLTHSLIHSLIHSPIHSLIHSTNTPIYKCIPIQ